MLNNEQELRAKIDSFMRRKEAQYPELAQASGREKMLREQFKPSMNHNLHFAFGVRH